MDPAPGLPGKCRPGVIPGEIPASPAAAGAVFAAFVFAGGSLAFPGAAPGLAGRPCHRPTCRAAPWIGSSKEMAQKAEVIWEIRSDGPVCHVSRVSKVPRYQCSALECCTRRANAASCRKVGASIFAWPSKISNGPVLGPFRGNPACRWDAGEAFFQQLARIAPGLLRVCAHRSGPLPGTSPRKSLAVTSLRSSGPACIGSFRSRSPAPTCTATCAAAGKMPSGHPSMSTCVPNPCLPLSPKPLFNCPNE